MITTNVYNLENDANYQGLSTDTKPRMGVPQNALFVELDTGDVYYCKDVGTYHSDPFLPKKTISYGQEGEYLDFEGYYGIFYNKKMDDYSYDVVFDDVRYTVKKIDDTDDEQGYNNDYGFGDYPFGIHSYKMAGLAWITIMYVKDNEDHTVEVFVNKGTPAYWSKIGE